jgi:hypothetical protein
VVVVRIAAALGGDQPVRPVPGSWPQQPAPAPAEGYGQPAGVLVAGAHGGAGTSTLAALLRPAWDLGTVPAPGSPRRGRLRPARRPVVLVTGCTVMAAGRAVAAANVLEAAGAPGIVLAVIGDGLPVPAQARYRFRLLEARLGAVVQVPFVPAFRGAASPAEVVLPRKAALAVARIRALALAQITTP